MTPEKINFAAMIAQYGQLIVQLGTLAATIYFYRQLVQNDNRREQRVERESIILWCKNAFRTSGNTGGMLQMVGKSLRTRYPNAVPLILDAYEELRNEEPELRMPMTSQFLEYMAGVEANEWPSNYKRRSAHRA